MYTLIGCWENTRNEMDAIFIYLFILNQKIGHLMAFW